MTSLFNLIDERWIPCIWATGQRDEISLRQTLLEAHNLREIYGDTPPEIAALYRILLAVLYSALRPIDDRRWQTMWKNQQWKTEELNPYFERQEVYSRFYLFDEEYPFFQSAQLERKIETVSSLHSHIASGADATLFDHTTAAIGYSLTLAQAARALVSVQAFGLSGTKGKPTKENPPFSDAPCARGVVFLIKGKTLFETLMLNLFDLDLSSHRLSQKQNDKPLWEMENPLDENPRRPYGYLDYLTWPNRCIRLCAPDANGMVREMMYEPGMKLPREVFNPMMLWRAAKAKPVAEEDDGESNAEKRSHSPIRFQQEKALWRDSIALLNAQRSREGEKGDKPLAALQMIENLIADKVTTGMSVTQAYSYDALGMASKLPHDKTFFYRAETMPLPLAYLNEESAKQLLPKLDESMNTANDVAKKLSEAVKKLATLLLSPSAYDKSGKKPDGKDVQKMIRTWDATGYFWPNLELPFRDLLTGLPVNPDLAISKWRETLKRLAWQAFDQAAEYAGDDPRALKAIIAAETQLTNGLK